MKILIYGNRKTDPTIYDISTPEKENAAFLLLFKMLDEDWEVYSDIEKAEKFEICKPCIHNLHDRCDEGNCICSAESCKKQFRRAESERKKIESMVRWLKEARRGSAESARKLMNARKSYDVLDPLAERTT